MDGQPPPLRSPAPKGGEAGHQPVEAPVEPLHQQQYQQPYQQQPSPMAQPISMQPMSPNGGYQSNSQRVTPLHLLSNQPQYIDCQFCKKRTQTRVEEKGKKMQIIVGCLLCCATICLAPLPCLLHWFEQTNWYCSECNQHIASRRPNNPVQVNPPPEAYDQTSQFQANHHHQQQQQYQPGLASPPPHMNPQDPSTMPASSYPVGNRGPEMGQQQQPPAPAYGDLYPAGQQGGPDSVPAKYN